MYQYMRGHVAALLVQFNRYKHWGNLYRILVSLPFYYTKLFFMGGLGGFQNRYITVISEILGCFAGIGFYVKKGFLLISTPNENWRFPYYEFMKPMCPPEAEVMAEWGHVRRGYTLDDLKALVGLPCQKYATFINPLTVLCHDVAFSRLSRMQRELLCTALSSLTWTSYWLHKPESLGTETASAWQKP